MAAIVFPSAPTVGQVFQAPNNITYVWTGVYWDGQYNTTFVTTKTSISGSSVLAAGNTAQRDASAAAGYLRWNTTTPGLEVYDGATWSAVGGGGSFTGQTSATGSSIIPRGTTAQRDAVPVAGFLRWNSTVSALELYNGTTWANVGGGGGTSVTVSETAPAGPTTGALWWDSTDTDARLFIYDGAVWVDTNPAATSGVSVATTAQAQAWTDDTTAISPLKLAEALQGSNQSLVRIGGYQKLPGGLIIQWGQVTVSAAAPDTTFTFPISFPNNWLNVVGTTINGAGSGDLVTMIGTVNLSSANFGVYDTFGSRQSSVVNVLAIGH